jgi:hypothetical protein
VVNKYQSDKGILWTSTYVLAIEKTYRSKSCSLEVKMKSLLRIVSLIFVFILLFSAVGPAAASDSAAQLVPAIAEPSSVGVGQSTNDVFRDVTTTFNYSGGPVCLSARGDQCSPLATDDAVRIFVDGVEVYYRESYTHDYGPVDFSNYLSAGTNLIRVQLIDLVGPDRGGSAIWLVGGSIPVISVSIQRDGDYYSPDGQGGSIPIEGQPRAKVPFIVTVTKNGIPVVAELQLLSPFNAYGGTTGPDGTSKGSIEIAVPPQSGDVYLQFKATVDGLSGISDPFLLYQVGSLYHVPNNITTDDVRAWGGTLFAHYMLDGGNFDFPDIFLDNDGNIFDMLIAAALSWFANRVYSPQIGDQLITDVYSFSAPNVETIYLLRRIIARNGSTLGEYNYFSKDSSKLDSILDNPNTLDHDGIEFYGLSPITFNITNPIGMVSGIDPNTGERVFGFPMALDETGEEPYRAFIPSAPDGRYLVQLVGTGDGPYTFSTYSLTHDGLATPTLSVSGLTHPGYITNFTIDYQSDTAVPIAMAVVGTVDIKPETLNLESMSGPNSVTAFIELPLGFDVTEIDLRTIRLEGQVPAQLSPSSIGDHNENGIPDLMVKFDRKLLIDYLKTNNLLGDNVPLKITGNYSANVQFTVTDSITVLKSSIFADVPSTYWAWNYVERLYNAGITGGCLAIPLSYCPETVVSRSQMAVFLLRGIHGSTYTPPPVGGGTGFADVAPVYWAAAWIKQLAAEGIMSGCGNGRYCPDAPVTRAQMAILLLRSKYGSSYTPPRVGASTGFGDVPPDYWAASWVKQLVTEGITAGCGSGNYCPENPVTRAQMAVFLVRTFSLP